MNVKPITLAPTTVVPQLSELPLTPTPTPSAGVAVAPLTSTRRTATASRHVGQQDMSTTVRSTVRLHLKHQHATTVQAPASATTVPGDGNSTPAAIGCHHRDWGWGRGEGSTRERDNPAGRPRPLFGVSLVEMLGS